MMTELPVSTLPEVERGPLGDARPKQQRTDPRTGGVLPQEDVEKRENFSTVTPEDYPAKDRAIADPAGLK